MEDKPKEYKYIAHGIAVCRETIDSIMMLGKQGLYYLDRDQIDKEKWSVRFYMGCNQQATEIYDNKESAIYAVIIADKAYIELFKGYEYDIDINEYMQQNKINVELKEIIKPERVQDIFFSRLEKIMFP